MDPQLELTGKIGTSQATGELDVGAGTGLRAQILQLEELVEGEIKAAKAKIAELKSDGTEPVNEKIVKEMLDKMQSTIQEAHDRTNTDLQDYYASVRDKNATTQKEITNVKLENAQLQQTLVAVQRRLKMLEVALGD
ncbi:unnamed protein product [Amoebophrya sp. A25]|nr:unnamed protein product [Amoebophrya sp. A25]|eukprot:GSA25T00000182001.1